MLRVSTDLGSGIFMVTTATGSLLWGIQPSDKSLPFHEQPITTQIQPNSNCLQPKVMLCARYIKFVKTLTSSTKSAVRFLSRLYQNDLRTVLLYMLHCATVHFYFYFFWHQFKMLTFLKYTSNISNIYSSTCFCSHFHSFCPSKL
jgi:hypothetical protein